MENHRRSWDVLLIGGASGVGKTSVSYRLARHYGVGITEIDDFQILLQKLTRPEHLPALHFWPTHPDPASLPPEEIFERGLGIGAELAEGLAAVIADHLQCHTPIVLEGDFLHPALAAQAEFAGQSASRVRAVFIDEPEEDQIAANFLQREPAAGLQAKRARVSWLYAGWLRREAELVGLPVIQSRPWETTLERIVALLG